MNARRMLVAAVVVGVAVICASVAWAALVTPTKVITGPGNQTLPSAAPGGAFDYVVKGAMIGGFAIVAHPVQYGTSGVMTFMINQDAVVWQKDLGPQTAQQVAAMKRFDPGPGWTKVR